MWRYLLAEWSVWRHLGCSCSRGGLSLQRADFVTDTLHVNPDKESCGGAVETGLIPLLFYLSQLILEPATHCSRRAEGVGWCVLMRLSHPGGVWGLEKGGSCGAVQPQSGGWAECNPLWPSLFRTVLCPFKVRGRLSFFPSFSLSLL